MVAPVLYHEMLLAGRRSQQHIFRWIYASWLILQIAFFSYLWLFTDSRYTSPTGELSAWFVELFLAQQLILMGLATPAFAAGAITEEKTSGTMQYLLTADLSPWDIVLGKLLARTLQMGALALTGLPLFCFLAAFAGVEPLAMLGVIGVTFAPLIALVAASILASVWCTQTRNAALGLYGGGAVVFLVSLWLGGVLVYFDPVYVLTPIWGARDLAGFRLMLQRLLGSFLAWGGIALVCVLLAGWRLRPAYRRQLEGEGRKKKARWWRPQRPPVSDQPIAWKEQQVEGLAPAASLRRLPRWLGVVAAFSATVASSTLILWLHLIPGASLQTLLDAVARLDLVQLLSLIQAPEGDFQVQCVVVLLFASLLVGIRCSGAVSGEREKLTWEALLLTPLSARQLIRGKLWGIMGASYIYLLAYAVPALALSLLGGLSSFFWTAIWLGVTVLAMYCIGAVGIWCSVRSKTSWRSLLWTVATGYVGGFVIFGVSSFPIAILALIVLLILMMISSSTGLDLVPSGAAGFAQFFTIFKVVFCLAVALMAWLISLLLLSSAQKYVSYRERTLQWADEPEPTRPRRKAARALR